MGRPSKYSDEIVDRICDRLATSSDGLHRICSEEGMPSVATVFNWLNNKENKVFLDKYARAREAQAELLADEIIDIADDNKKDTLISENGNPYQNAEWIGRARLRVDARKWKASKLYPKKYGDRLDVEQSLTGDISIKVVRELPKATNQENLPTGDWSEENKTE